MNYLEIEKLVKSLEGEDFSMPINLTNYKDSKYDLDYSKDLYLSKTNGSFNLSFVDKRSINYRTKKYRLLSQEVLKLIKRKLR